MTYRQIHKLVLHPRDSNFALTSWDVLIARLREAAFLDKPFNTLNKEHQNRFLVGERFLQYITLRVAHLRLNSRLQLTDPWIFAIFNSAT
jgi:hypothetical protein